MRIYRTFSSRETKKLGEKFTREIVAHPPRRHAAVVALKGDLGSGKTTFVQGFFRALGLRRAPSPTFIIMRRSSIRRGGFRNVYHVDAYRIKDPRGLASLGFRDILAEPRNIVLVEWAENIKTILPRTARWIRFSHGKHEHERIVRLKG